VNRIPGCGVFKSIGKVRAARLKEEPMAGKIAVDGREKE